AYQPRRPTPPRTALGSGPVSADVPGVVQLEPPPPPARVEAPPSAPRPQVGSVMLEGRARLVAALALGLAAGFAPAHLYGSAAEDRRDEMGVELLHEPPPATDAAYDLLLERHAATRARMVRTKARIEIATALIWLAGGAAVTFAYWRFMPRSSGSRR